MLTPVLTAALAAYTPQSVRLDGRLDEWPDAASARPAVQATRDNGRVYLLLELPGAPVNLQGLDSPMTLHLDWDGQKRTGDRNGRDLDIVFSPKLGRRNGGVAIVWPGARGADAQRWEAADFAFAPTTASDRFELSLPRTLQTPDGALEVGQTVRWRLERSGERPATGSAEIGPSRQAPAPWMAGPLPPPASDATRVVSWNLERGNFIDEAPTVRKLLAVMQPHIVLIQELKGEHGEQDVRRVLQDAMPGRRWTVATGASSGDIKGAVATSLQASEAESFKQLLRPGEANRPIRAAALRVSVPGVGQVLTASAHLKCCGVVGGPEDLTRIGEVMGIRHAVHAEAQDGQLKGLIVGGDLNLVGGRMPLDMLTHEGSALIDPDLTSGSDLLVVDAWQPDGGSLTTWQKPGQAYSPGRLDFILVDQDAMQPQGTLVLDTLDFSDEALGAMGLGRNDTATASDHLPVIVDLVPKRN